MKKKGNPKKRSKKITQDVTTKQYAERVHATRRLWERYGEIYTSSLRTILIKSILLGKTIEQEKQTNNYTRHLINIDNKYYNVIYDKKRREIVTFLPMKKEFDMH